MIKDGRNIIYARLMRKRTAFPPVPATYFLSTESTENAEIFVGSLL